MASVLDLVKHYQRNIDRHRQDEQKVLKCIDKLFHLDVKVHHLQETGVGRTVNALRKDSGNVGNAARALVYKWKIMVASEESDQDDEEKKPSVNGNECKKDPDGDANYSKRYNENENQQFRRNEKYDTPSIESRSQLRESSNGDYSGSKRKQPSSEEEEPQSKRSRHSNSSENDEYKKLQNIKCEPTETDQSQSDESNSESSEYSEEEKKVNIKTEPPGQSSSFKYLHNNYNDHKKESSSSKKSHSSTEKHSKHLGSESKHSSDKLKEGSYSTKNKSVEVKTNDSLIKKEKEHKSNKNKRSNEESSSSSKAFEHKSSSQKNSSSSSEKQRSVEKISKLEKHSSSYRSEKEKNRGTEKESCHEKNKSKDSREKSSSSKDEKSKDSSKKEKASSHRSDKKHSSSSSKSDSRSKSEKSNSSEKKSHSSSSSSHRSSKSSKSKEDIPKKIVTEKTEDSDDGIDCVSGASFADALGMVTPTKAKKKSTLVKDSLKHVSSTSAGFDSVDIDLSPAVLLAPTAKLAPLPTLEISALPEISPNYKPRPPPKFLPHFNEEDAMIAVISSKNQRTKVYSGNKIIGKVPSLYEMCVNILQEHIDDLEFTGGVPYEILKPIVDKATPQQLFMLEHYNPYLIEDTDHLWQKHCEKHFRVKKRQELESWREMYLRCQEEQEVKLRSLTENIKLTQEAKKAPIKQTKMAYVDTVVKPPRNVARKQAMHGTKYTATASPAARVAALATAPNVLKGGVRPSPAAPVSSSAFNKAKKAPLMQKALQFMRGRKR